MPDVNLLVYAHRREDPDHEFYRQWMENLANGREPFALSSLVAMSLSRVKRVVYGAADPKIGAAGGALNLLQFEGMNHRCEVRGGVRAEECRELLREFFQRQRAENGAGRE